jgi:hypothetical protein
MTEEKDRLAGYTNLSRQLFSCRTWNISLKPSLHLDFVLRSVVILMDLPSYVTCHFSFAAFSSFFVLYG